MEKMLYITGIMSLLLFLTVCKTPPPEPVREPVIMPTPETTPGPAPDPTPVPAPSPERPYYIEVFPPGLVKDYRINPFSFIHAFYSFIFFEFDLTSLIPFNERKDIIKTIYKEILPGSQVNFVIKKYLNVDKLSLVFFTESGTGELILHLNTNYDRGAAVLIPLDMPKEEWKRCVSVSYLVKESKLVHASDLYSPDREKELSETRQFVDLAHLYIFDENDKNDEQVETILNNIITKNTNERLSLKASYELVYFYLLHERITEAEIAMDRTVPLLETPQVNTDKKVYEILIEEFEIVKELYE